MKAIAYLSMTLGAIAILIGLLALNPFVALFGCIGWIAGAVGNRQLTHDKRLSTIESQLRIILQTQRQPTDPVPRRRESWAESYVDEDDAYDYLSDD